MPKNPDQGSFLLPGIAGTEFVPEGGSSFTLVPKPADEGIEGSEEPLSASVTERSAQLDRLLTIMGVIAETLPAVEATDGKDTNTKDVLKKKFGANYDVQVAKMMETHSLYKSMLDDSFAQTWKLDDMRSEGAMSSEEVDAFEEDKKEFVELHMKSDESSTDKAKNARATSRYKYDRQQMRYQAADIGDWPKNKAREKRIATIKRQLERKRQKRRAA